MCLCKHNFYSVRRNVGYFYFENGLFQQFTLQLCESTSCINCYITIHSERLPIEEGQLLHLLQQRQSLLSYLESSISEVNRLFMPSAKKPIAHLECPFEHEQNCPPHLPINIEKQELFLCLCNNERMSKIVPEVYYIQLFEMTSLKSELNNYMIVIDIHITKYNHVATHDESMIVQTIYCYLFIKLIDVKSYIVVACKFSL